MAEILEGLRETARHWMPATDGIRAFCVSPSVQQMHHTMAALRQAGFFENAAKAIAGVHAFPDTVRNLTRVTTAFSRSPLAGSPANDTRLATASSPLPLVSTPDTETPATTSTTPKALRRARGGNTSVRKTTRVAHSALMGLALRGQINLTVSDRELARQAADFAQEWFSKEDADTIASGQGGTARDLAKLTLIEARRQKAERNASGKVVGAIWPKSMG